MRHPGWTVVPVAVLAAAAPAYAVQYMTADEAMRHAYGDAQGFAPLPVALRPEQWQAIDHDTPAPVATRVPQAWTATRDSAAVGRIYVDEVLGKQLFIRYAVAIDPDGRVRRVDILEYRETHGFEVRNARWLAQFNGKDAGSELRLDGDIKNISGATLSCRHVTQGVRRLLAIDRAQHASS